MIVKRIFSCECLSVNIILRPLFSLCWLCFWGAFLFLVGCDDSVPQPVIEDGVVDLSKWDFEKDGATTLHGQWRFVWDDLLEPIPGQNFRDKHSGSIPFPALWHDQPNPNQPEENLPTTGYGTYVLEVQLAPEYRNKQFTLSSPYQSGAGLWRITTFDASQTLGQAKQGTVATTKETEVSIWVDVNATFQVPESGRFLIWFQSSNFHFPRGGTWYVPQLGLQSDISENVKAELILDASIFGICAIIALYHFILFFQRRKDISSLCFAFFSAMFAWRQWFSKTLSQKMGYLHSTAGQELHLMFEWMALPLLVFALATFVQSLVPSAKFKLFIKVFGLFMGSALVLFTILAPSFVVASYLDIFQLHLLIVGTVCYIYLIYHGIRGHTMARWLLFANSFVLVGGIVDILAARSIVSLPYISAYTFLVFIFIQSVILSGKTAAAHKQAEHLTWHLQEEVTARTKDLELKTIEAQEASSVAIAAKEEADVLRLQAEAQKKEVDKLNYMLTETVLKRYISPTLVDKIISGELSMEKPAELRRITILFSDLSGFTSTSEQLGPQIISQFLNEYLTKMNDIIFAYDGTIDKFIGDAIMVIFGAPQDMSDKEQAVRATDCAFAMQQAMSDFLQEWKKQGVGHLQMRIGLHQGDAIVGNFGSDKRSDYTCIGPTVNLAARIESAAEPGSVFLSTALRSLLAEDRATDAGIYKLKGIEEQQRLYRLLPKTT